MHMYLVYWLYESTVNVFPHIDQYGGPGAKILVPFGGRSVYIRLHSVIPWWSICIHQITLSDPPNHLYFGGLLVNIRLRSVVTYILY